MDKYSSKEQKKENKLRGGRGFYYQDNEIKLDIIKKILNKEEKNIKSKEILKKKVMAGGRDREGKKTLKTKQ